MSILSKVSGWGRASLYHHFPGGKKEIAARALAHVGEKAKRNVLLSLEGPDSPRVKLERFASAVLKFYRNGQLNCIVASVVLGGGRDEFADTLKGSVLEWMAALSAVLVRAGVGSAEAMRRAENALVQIQGALILTRCLQSEEPFRRVMRELPSTLLAGRE